MSLRSIRLGTTTTFAALTCFGAAGQSAISRQPQAHGPPDCGRACICAPPAQLSRKARADFDEVGSSRGRVAPSPRLRGEGEASGCAHIFETCSSFGPCTRHGGGCHGKYCGQLLPPNLGPPSLKLWGSQPYSKNGPSRILRVRAGCRRTAHGERRTGIWTL